MKIIDSARALFAAAPRVARKLVASSTNPDDPATANQWRRLGRASSRNLAGFQHQDMVRQCVKSAQVDGMARSHVRLVRSITVGAEEVRVAVKCRDEDARARLQELADIGWNHPSNNLSAALGGFMDSLCSTGSLPLTLETDANEAGLGSMLTTVGYIDPESFADPGVLTDPGNARNPIAVLRGAWLTTSPSTVIAHPIVRDDGSVHKLFRDSDGAPLTQGTGLVIPRQASFGGPLHVTVDLPCMYLGVNTVGPNQTLGVSDLWPSLDLMGLLDGLVFGAVRRANAFGAYSIHAKFPRGTPQATIDAHMTMMRADVESGEGRLVATTNDIELGAVAPSLQAGETAELEKMARVAALTGLGPWPIHVFSDGGTTNVATAAEQGSPVANFLLDRQNAFARFIQGVVKYMVRRYPEGRRLLEANPDAEFHLSLPVIVAKDTTRESNVWQVETNSLMAAVENGFVTRKAAAAKWRELSARYGIALAPEDCEGAVDAFEAEKQKAADAFALPKLSLPGDPPPDPKAKVSEGTPKAAAA